MQRAIILMGVSGSGKTTIGQQLSDTTGWPFFDGDDFHPEENVRKMASGTPLTDQDRLPWLGNLHGIINKNLLKGQSLIVACSALKKSYRNILAQGLEDQVLFVYLKGEFDLIFRRLSARSDHYMKPGMLQSQFMTLEEPEGAFVFDISKPTAEVVREISAALGLPGKTK